MRSLKPEFINALDQFIAAHSDVDKIENWFLRRRIVVELGWQANSNSYDDGQIVLFPDQSESAIFTVFYRHEVVIDGKRYTIVAKQEDFTGKKGGPIITTLTDL